MRNRQPLRALIAGATVAAPLTLISGLFLTLGERGLPLAAITLILLALATACLMTQYVHAVDAILMTALLAGVGVFLIGILVLGLEALLARYEFGGWMFAAIVGGAIAGIFVRAGLRRKSK